MADRWFVVSIVTNPTWDPIADQAPKYADTSGISGWAGQTVTINGTDYYVVRFVGTTSALDQIESKADATSLQEAGLSKSDVAAYLNDATGHNYSFAEWEQRFFTDGI